MTQTDLGGGKVEATGAARGGSQPYARLIRGINRLSRDHLAMGLRAAAATGLALGGRLGDAWTPAAAEVRDLLGDLGFARVSQLQRQIASRELRNRALLYVLRHRGPEPIVPLVRVRDIGGFQRLRDEKVPLVVVFWHLGVVRSTGIALRKLDHRILMAMFHPPRGPEMGYAWRTVENLHSRTRFLMAALKEIAEGSVPVLSADGLAGPKSPAVPFFGRSMLVPPGAAILARRSGARLVPATSRWVGASPAIEVTLHEPITEPEVSRSERAMWEQEILNSTVRWFERHLRAHPADLRPLNFRESYRGKSPAEAASPP